jgi:cytochrome c-type biogenesis protein CcmF
MGGFWAYETLGWGGFWVWDPVENTSFVPWCALAAFTHGIIVQQARSKWHMTNVILGAAPFLLFCYGTFLTRSGFLGDTSVHSFARMDPQALGILIALIGFSFFGFIGVLVPALKWWKTAQPKVEEGYEKHVWNKSAFYGVAMWLLFAFGLVTAVGMSVPLIQSLVGQAPKVVEESLYNQVLGWFFVPAMVAIGLAPYANWRGESFRSLGSKVLNQLALAIMFTGFLLLWSKAGWQGQTADPTMTTSIAGVVTLPRLNWIAFLAFLTFFAIFSNLFKLWEMLPRARKTAGGVLTHAGVGMALLGLIVSRGLEQKKLVTVHPSKPAEAFDYQINYVGPTKGFANRNNEVKLSVSGDRGNFVAHPGLYFRPGEEGPQETIWPHIERRPLYDLYFTLHPMVWEASEPQGLTKGQQARFENFIVTYQGLRTTGVLGTDTAKFFADATVQILGDPVNVSPSLALGGGESTAQPARTPDGSSLYLLRADMDKSTIVLRLSSQPSLPLSLAQGASIDAGDLRLTFKSMRTEQGASPDQARLVADVTVEEIVATTKVAPMMSMADGQKVRLNSEYELALERIDAATKAAFFRFDYVQPAYPLEVYYKPLTWLVWFGVGIMTIGALWSSRGRRVVRDSQGPRDESPQEPEPVEAEEKTHEAVPTA